MSAPADLRLTKDQVLEIINYADAQRTNPTADSQILATALQIVALSLNRSQADDPPVSGPEVDEWYDNEFGQNIRMMWNKLHLNPASDRLRELGVIS